MKRSPLRTGSIALALLLAALLSGVHAAAADALIPLPPAHVKVAGQIGKRIEVTVRNNLLALDWEKDFLQPFKEKKGEGGYIGLGKLLETLARLAAYTGDPEVMSLERRLVSQTIECQEQDGYLGMLRQDARMWGLWDLSEMGYLIQGLVTDRRLFGEERSLRAATKLADYIVTRWAADSAREPGGGKITVHMAVVGLEAAMLALHEATGDPRYLAFCAEFRKLPEWNPPIVLGRWGKIEGHVYAYLAECLAQLRLFRIRPDPRLLEPTRRALDFLVRRDGLLVTGASGDHECWHDTQEGTINLGETCA